MNPARKPIAALALALALAGCANMRGLSTHATPAAPDSLAAGKALRNVRLTPAAWPHADWWTRLHDSQLDQLMNEALAGSPTLRVAEARVRRALAFAQSTRSALYPQVNADSHITRERYPEHSLVPPPLAGSWDTQAELETTLGYEVDLWGKNRAAYASAIGQAKAAEIDSYAARLALSVNIAQTYVQMQRAYLQLDVAEKSLKEREQIHKLTLERFDAGIETRVAVKQTESELPATRERIAQLQETIGLARNELAALAGQGPDRGLALGRPAATAFAGAVLPAELPAELLGRRPDLVAQRWRVEAARREIDVARAEFFPNVNLAAFIGFQSIGLSGFLRAASATAGAGPAITLPIFDGGRRRGNLAGKDADYDVAVETYNQALVDALREVVDQLVSMRSVAEQRKQQALGEAAAQTAYDLAVQRYREGIGNFLDVLASETQLLAQQSLDVDLRARELTLSINLTRTLGGGFEPVEVPVAQAAPVRAPAPPAHKTSWLARLFGR